MSCLIISCTFTFTHSQTPSRLQYDVLVSSMYCTGPSLSSLRVSDQYFQIFLVTLASAGPGPKAEAEADGVGFGGHSSSVGHDVGALIGGGHAGGLIGVSGGGHGGGLIGVSGGGHGGDCRTEYEEVCHTTYEPECRNSYKDFCPTVHEQSCAAFTEKQCVDVPELQCGEVKDHT